MDIINIVISFIEIFGMFLVYNTFVNNKLKGNIQLYSFMSFFTSIIYYISVKFYSVDQLIVLMTSLFVNAIFISKLEKKETITVLVKLILSFVTISIMELITIFFIHIIFGEDDLSSSIYCILLTNLLFIMILLLKKYFKNRKIHLEEFVNKYKSINIIILNIFIFILLIKILIANGLVNTSIAVQVTMLSFVLIGINVYFYFDLYKALNKKKKSEIKSSFNPLINELMAKVKSNEHEYNNHLNAIWGIAQVSEPEEVKEKIKKYIGEITGENEQFSKLLHIDNTIIKAVLYNKIQRAEKLGVNCQYSVKSDLKSIPVDDSELTVIFSNLLNNAIEATSMIKDKKIVVNIEEDEKRYYIIVKNRVENFDMANISKIFKIGYSTKGEGRGYGLYNVKKIIDKYKGKIAVEIHENILAITVLFNK